MMADVKFYLAIFLRRLPYFLILLFIGSAVGITSAMILPPVYQSNARLVVESEQIPDELAQSTVQTDVRESLQIIRQRILTRDALLELAREQGVYEGAGRPDEPMTPDQIVSDMRARIKILTRGGTVRRGQSAVTIVTVGFSGPTGQMAANVSNEVVTLILGENVEMRREVSGETLDFFTQQVQQFENELTQISQEILRFKEANQSALPESLEFRRRQQAAEQERLLDQERQENLLRDRRAQLTAMLEVLGPDALPQQNLTAEEQQLKQLQDRLATSVAVLSLDNPRLTVLRAQIAALEEVVADQRALRDATQGALTGQAPMSPIELQIADIDGQLDFIAEQKVRIQERLDELEASIRATPANALALQTLNRTQQNLQDQYNRARRSMNTAELGDTIEALSKGQRISVLEQASVPSAPTSPDRERIAMAGVGAGMAMGFGFIVLLELLNTKVRRAADLRRGLELEPFMALPYMRTRSQIWRRRGIIAAGCAVVMIGLPAALWYVDQNIRPLQPYLDPVLARVGLA